MTGATSVTTDVASGISNAVALHIVTKINDCITVCDGCYDFLYRKH